MDPVMVAKGITLVGGSESFNFELASGEIVGLVGLDGHGQETFLRTLCGLSKPLTGRVMVCSDTGRHEIPNFKTAFAHGIVYLPRDRKSEGIFPSLSILDNFRVLTLQRSSRLGFVRRRPALDAFERHRERLSIVLPGPAALITSLSGGNQQKVLLARLLESQPRVMLLNDPTRGVDYPTRLALYAALEELSTQSAVSIVVLSTENEEIVSHCHRAIVFREGAPIVELDRDTLTTDTVLAGMFGMTGQGEAS